MAWKDKQKAKVYWLKVKDEYNRQKRERWKTDTELREHSRLRKIQWLKNNPDRAEKYLKYQKEHRTPKLYVRFRFKVFMRDDFTCIYCGRKPPEVVLEIDHIEPKARGGLDKMENYATACRDCNRGKSDMLLKK